MGLYILSKAFKKIKLRKEAPKHIGALALTGGFVDSVGGGGWGPVVTTSLVGTGQDPRTTIGSVNAAEFFLSIAGATAFAVCGSVFSNWPLIAGLVIGGFVCRAFSGMVMPPLTTQKFVDNCGCIN